MHRVRVFDTTLRDGEQSPGATLTPKEKLRLAHQLDALGVDVIEAGFPASSPGDYAAVRKIGRDLRRPTIAALARAKRDDIERAGSALAGMENARIHVFIATSDIHLRRKLCISRAECLERVVVAVERARQFTDDVEFSAEDATRTDMAFLCRAVETAIDAGATTINIPDTVGYSHPEEFGRMLRTLRATVQGLDDVVLSVHCHDDLGLAVANSITGVRAGARQIECTVNGIGERAGNTSLEEVVMALRIRGEELPYQTAVNTREIYPTSRLLSHFTGIHPQPNKAIVGENAFAHEAGIHQDGMIKDPTTYEIMTPAQVGVPRTRLVLGKHSGRSALRQRYRDLGYELDEYDVDHLYGLFKPLADRKKQVLDEDLITLLQPGALDGDHATFELRSLEVTCGSSAARARVRVKDPGGRELGARAEGDGPVAAAFTALDALVDFRIGVDDLKIRAATPGRDAVGEVALRLRVNGKTFTGRGASVDIVTAAVRAYLHALNKAVRARELEAEALEEASDLWGV